MVQELVEYIVKQLVAQPDSVTVTIAKRGNMRILEIIVDEQDRGKVIGKEGQTIKALRSLIEVIVPEGKKVTVELA